MIEDLLRGAEIRTPAYTPEQRAADERALRERIDEVVQRRARAAQAHGNGWLVPTSPELAALILQSSDLPMRASTPLKHRLNEELTALCRLVFNAPGAGDRLVKFMDAVRPTDTVAARAFGCLMYVAGHTDDARFWWRYAAGGDDATAAYCLFLEGLLRDVPAEAVHCYRAYGAGEFLCDEDWPTFEARPTATETAIETDVREQVQEVNTGQDGHVRIPGAYLDEVPQAQRDELLCHH